MNLRMFLLVAAILFSGCVTCVTRNPALMVKSHKVAVKLHLIKHVAPDKEGDYPKVSISKIVHNQFRLPRALVEGRVAATEQFEDGDWHINVSDGKNILVCEIIPEFPLKIPQVGDNVKIWGITRYDLEHGWWELHPVLGWELK